MAKSQKESERRVVQVARQLADSTNTRARVTANESYVRDLRVYRERLAARSAR